MKVGREPKLSVEDKISAVLQLAEVENEVLSVAEVCKRARVNRSNLYHHHPDLVAKIKKRKRPPISKKQTLSATDLQSSIKNLKTRNQALLYLVVELTNRVHSLERQIERAAKRNTRSKTRK